MLSAGLMSQCERSACSACRSAARFRPRPHRQIRSCDCRLGAGGREDRVLAPTFSRFAPCSQSRQQFPSRIRANPYWSSSRPCIDLSTTVNSSALSAYIEGSGHAAGGLRIVRGTKDNSCRFRSQQELQPGMSRTFPSLRLPGTCDGPRKRLVSTQRFITVSPKGQKIAGPTGIFEPGLI